MLSFERLNSRSSEIYVQICTNQVSFRSIALLVWQIKGFSCLKSENNVRCGYAALNNQMAEVRTSFFRRSAKLVVSNSKIPGLGH